MRNMNFMEEKMKKDLVVLLIKICKKYDHVEIRCVENMEGEIGRIEIDFDDIYGDD